METEKLSIETFSKWLNLARAAHKKWWEDDMKMKLGYKYYETLMKPETWPEGVRYYAQLNLFKESADSFMGIVTSSKLAVNVRGRNEGPWDDLRINVIQKAVEAQLDEADVRETLFGSILLDFYLAGMAYGRPRWKKDKLTKLNHMGGLEFDRMYPGYMKPDPFGQKQDLMGGRYLIYDQIMNADQFELEVAYPLSVALGKQVNVDKIIRSTYDSKHWDSVFANKGKPLGEQKITVAQVDYYRWVEKTLAPKVSIKVPEYRVALVAGDEIIADDVNPIGHIRTWSSVCFPNNPIHESPYSFGPIKEFGPIQDLINTMISMKINNDARKMNDPIAMLAGTMPSENFIKDISGTKFLMLNWDESMASVGITPRDVFPRRIEGSQNDTGWDVFLDWIVRMSERVSSREIVKGRTSSSARSGVAISLLQNAALQPSNYAKEKLSAPLRILGSSIYSLMKDNLTYEMELPLSSVAGQKKSIVINQEIPRDKIPGLFERAKGDDRQAQEDILMLSVTMGDSRMTVETFLERFGQDAISNEETFGRVQDDNGQIRFVKNDIAFGDWEVSLSLDTTAEQIKAERVSQMAFVNEILARMSAPTTALEYTLDTIEHPQKDEIVKKAVDESEIIQLGMQAKAQMEEAQKQQQKEQGVSYEQPMTPGMGE